MNLLFPTLKLRNLPLMLGIVLAGGLSGGVYGVFHDLFTYSISPEYFTRLKFHQFAYADFGFPPRIFAAEIGMIATGAVGLIGGWFIARRVVPHELPNEVFPRALIGFAMMIFCTVLAGMVGYLLGINHTGGYERWENLCETLGVTDVPSFVRVAYIHNASYLGGLIGLITALIWLSPRKTV